MKKAALLSILLLPFLRAGAQLTTRIVKDGLFIPWELCYGGDDRIWFTQKNGYICRMVPTTGQTDTVYHETATAIQGEGGMLGMALHPDFPAVPHVFVAHNYSDNGYKVRVMRYTWDGTALGAPLVIFSGIAGSQNHNGCRLLIDGDKLYITTGDAENLSTPQNLQSKNGKVHRINLDGSIPADNPFGPSSVWSLGHRNAQGLTIHNGMVYSSEHGPGSDDEVNIIQKGRNYGWPDVAGFCNTASEQAFCADSNVVVPLQAWTPTIAVSGITHYHHPMFPQFAGSLLMNTLKDQKLYQLRLNGAGTAITAATPVPGVSFGRLRGIGVSPQGRIYISTSNSPASGNGAKTDRIVEIWDPSYVPTSVPTVSGKRLRIYPNPARGEIVVEGGKNEAYIITGADGRVVDRGNLSAGKLSFKSLPPGVYGLSILNIGSGRFVNGE